MSDAGREPFPLTDATRAYLAAFDQWLGNPSQTNFDRKADALLRFTGRAPAANVASCKGCGQDFERRPGPGRPRLKCERCRPSRAKVPVFR